MECNGPKWGLFILHTKIYLVGFLKLVPARLYVSLFTFNDVTQVSFFILLYLLLMSTFICPTLVLIFFGQLSTLNYVKLTTGLEPTNFLSTTVKLILCC